MWAELPQNPFPEINLLAVDGDKSGVVKLVPAEFWSVLLVLLHLHEFPHAFWEISRYFCILETL